MTPAQISLSLTLEPEAEPITGTFRAAGEEHPFRGWIELVALIESLRELGVPPRGEEAKRNRAPYPGG